MNTIIFNLIIYFIFTGLVTLGRSIEEKWKWYYKVFSFLFGWILTPILIGRIIKKLL